MSATNMLPNTKLATALNVTVDGVAADTEIAGAGRVELWQITNTGEATVYYAGQGGTASAETYPIEAGESSGWIMSNDTSLSLYCATTTTVQIARVVQA
jgi:hypothetical protein